MNKPNIYKDYLFTYKHKGKGYDIHVRATSPEDAKARVSALFYNGKYLGVSFAIFDVPASPSVIESFKKWWSWWLRSNKRSS